MRGEGIYLQDGPVRWGERVYTCRTDQSDEGRGYIPAVSTRSRTTLQSQSTKSAALSSHDWLA
eukprot:47258-Pyramimonas_sp.AAC.1